ncbi:MAG: Panacea domain-containing protein [Terriglobia bacterium]
MKSFVEDNKKFRELILYISQKCATDPTFGATKLNKILFYADFLAYANLGKAITNFDYQKLANGPAPRTLLPIRDQMIADRELALQQIRLLSGNIQKRTVNLRPPDLTVFTGEEIALVDEVIEAFEKAKAEVVSELSHRMVGWMSVENGESIPYNTIFLSNEELTPAEIERGRELGGQYRLLA